MKITELRGLALLDAVIAQIETHPETWRQEMYRCETGMCVAGWAAEMTGGQWRFAAGGFDGHLLTATPDDSPHYVADGVIEAGDRAMLLLGIGEDDANHLFAGANTLADIKRIRDELAAGGLA